MQFHSPYEPNSEVRQDSGILLQFSPEGHRLMRKVVAVFCLSCAAIAAYAVPPATQPNWKMKVAAEMPLLGHRNWILVVDSAYPLQSSPGVETIETNANQIDVVRAVLSTMNASIHVRPDIYMDAELPFVSDSDAPGAATYRTQIANLLHDYQIESVPHDKIIANIGETGSQFHVLVLKTNMTIPYSSVFIRLDCKYWSADAEKRMRARMGATASPAKR